METQRFVRKNGIVNLEYHAANGACNACGAYTIVKPETRCKPATCLLCGTTQCMSNGLGNGCCKVCFYGLLPEWAGNEGVCRYKGCKEKAVARGIRGKRFVCQAHFIQQQGSNFLAKRLAERNKEWVLV